MPFVNVTKPRCTSCDTPDSTLWRKGVEQGQVFCCACARKELDGLNDSSSTEGSKDTIMGKDGVGSHFVGPLALRKSARLKPSKYKHQAAKPLATKGKSRRVIFKKNPIKAANAVATTITSNHIFFDGQYWQIGDIVSIMDHDGGIYYAQLGSFLQDQYCEKSAVITWLLPTTASIPGKFHPSSYILGPEEDLPRPMTCFEFIMHAPSSYYLDKSAPYPTRSEIPELGYISTSLGGEVRRLPSQEQIFGLQDIDSDVTDNPPEKIKVKQDADRKRKREQKERKIPRNKDKKASRDKPKETKVVPKEDLKVLPKEKPLSVAESRPRRDRGRAKNKDLN